MRPPHYKFSSCIYTKEGKKNIIRPIIIVYFIYAEVRKEL